MTAQIIDGKKISQDIREEVKHEVEVLKDKGQNVGLAAVLVGDNPASAIYIKYKAMGCEEVGIQSEVKKYPKELKEEELLSLIDDLNQRQDVSGILVQLPLPPQISEEKVILRIDPQKDVDGFHPYNVGMMLAGKPTFLPCTPYGIQELLIRSGNDPSGKHVVILGRGSLVGKPLSVMLSQKQKGANATVTLCHTGTQNLPHFTREADILVAAMGKPEFVKKDMVKSGAVVIDVGTNRVEDKTAKKGYRIVGDVDFQEVSQIAGAITPVPGGVGPMTVTMLLKNTLKAAKIQKGL